MKHKITHKLKSKKHLARRKNSYAPFLVIFAICLISLVIWRSSITSPQPIDINQIANTSSGNVDLSLSPSSISLTQNTEESINLTINSGEAKVTAAQIVLTYDPAILGTPTITQGTFLTNVLSSPKIESGKITFTYATSPDSLGQGGSGLLATIKLKPIAVGSTTISFAEGTMATATSHPDNVVKSVSDTQIVVTSPEQGSINAITPPTDTNAQSLQPSTPAPTPLRTPSRLNTQPVAPVAPIINQNPTATTQPPNSLSYTSDVDEPVGDYPFTQSDLDKEFDPAQNLNFFQRILAFFSRIFNK